MAEIRTIVVDRDHPDPAVIDQASQILRSGGLVAFATETVYGLGADATNPSAVAKIFEAKGRPSTNPLIVHVKTKEAALDCVSSWPERAEVLADRFWPGPLTIVLPRSSIIPDIVTAGQDTVGVRVPSTAVARWLILYAGRPIAAPSANRSLGVSPTLAQHVLDDLDGKIDLILDSGPTTVGIESTVVDLTGERPRILRPGQITLEEISQVLGEDVSSSDQQTGPAKSPGQMPVHYAPRTPAYRLETLSRQIWILPDRFCRIDIGPPRDGFAPIRTSEAHRERYHFTLSTPEEASRELYAMLRTLDAFAYEFILIIPPPDEPQWRALRDRIWRATQPWPADGIRDPRSTEEFPL
jgi:L-threonylcarbamoyladenylate synthase